MFQTKVVEKIKRNFAFQQLFSENRAAFEKMRKNLVQPDRPQIAIQYDACALHVE